MQTITTLKDYVTSRKLLNFNQQQSLISLLTFKLSQSNKDKIKAKIKNRFFSSLEELEFPQFIIVEEVEVRFFKMPDCITVLKKAQKELLK